MEKIKIALFISLVFFSIATSCQAGVSENAVSMSRKALDATSNYEYPITKGNEAAAKEFSDEYQKINDMVRGYLDRNPNIYHSGARRLPPLRWEMNRAK